MRILLIGDYSNYHRCLAGALRRLGHDVTVVSSGDKINTERDIDTARRLPGKLGGIELWFRLCTTLAPKLKDYDIVQINSPIFVHLRPHRVRQLFDRLKRNNKAVYLSAMGTDTTTIDLCTDPSMPLRYNEWMINGQPSPLYNVDYKRIEAWRNPPLSTHCDYIYSNIDGAITALYEYSLACSRVLPDDKIGYAGIPIDTETITPIEINPHPDKVKLFLGMKTPRMLEKGTDRILAAAKKTVELHPDKCQLEIVEDLPYVEYLERMKNAHIVLDQLYSFTPATNALLSMAYGIPTGSGAEPEYYDFIGEYENRPIINLVPDDEQLFMTIEDFVLHPERIAEIGRRSREFVVKHNDSITVAQRFIDFWNKPQLQK